jgi:uncharacterized membrane protein YfcA
MLVNILNYFELDIILIIFTSVFLGGIIKGTVGIGLSMFAVPIIAFFFATNHINDTIMFSCVGN